jgi:hypothetical protein
MGCLEKLDFVHLLKINDLILPHLILSLRGEGTNALKIGTPPLPSGEEGEGKMAKVQRMVLSR